MTLKERIQFALQKELEPLGFRYFKSLSTFKQKIDKYTTIELVYDADCFHHGFTDVTLLAGAEYRDIEEVQYKLTNRTVATAGHLGFVCRLQWLLPEGESANWDFSFRDSDSEETIERKQGKLLQRMKNYLLPYIDKLSHKDSAIEATAMLDRMDLLFHEGLIPIMYWVWKHDKQAALDYLEEKRLRLLKRVKTEEWELVERFKSGERFGEKNPFNALTYNEFMTFSTRFKEWVEEQDY